MIGAIYDTAFDPGGPNCLSPIVGAICLLANFGPAFATEFDVRSPSFIQRPGLNIAQRANVDLDKSEIFVIENGGITFKAPTTYIIGRRARGDSREIHHLAEFQFAYWMPDGAPTERDAGSLVGYRPKESRRPNPGPNEYVVRVVLAESIKSGKETEYVRAGGGRYTPPLEMFENTDGSHNFLTSGEHFEREQIFGLIAFIPKDKSFPRQTYRTPEAARTQAFIECNTPAAARTFPSCVANVFFRDEGFSFRLQFPREKISDWKSISERALALVKSWRS